MVTPTETSMIECWEGMRHQTGWLEGQEDSRQFALTIPVYNRPKTTENAINANVTYTIALPSEVPDPDRCNSSPKYRAIDTVVLPDTPTSQQPSELARGYSAYVE